jgi:hypothetical protein
MKIIFKLSKKFAFYVTEMEKYSFAANDPVATFPDDLHPSKILDYLRNKHTSIKWVETKQLHSDRPIYSFYFTDPADEAFFLVWSNEQDVDIY